MCQFLFVTTNSNLFCHLSLAIYVPWFLFHPRLNDCIWSFSSKLVSIHFNVTQFDRITVFESKSMQLKEGRRPRARTTDTQWRRHKSKKSEKFGGCGKQNMLRPYLKIWDCDWIFGHAVKANCSLGVRSPCHYTLDIKIRQHW